MNLVSYQGFPCRLSQEQNVHWDIGVTPVLCISRLNQDRLRKKQGAKDKLRRLVAPLLGITGASGGKLAFKAFSTIRPRISLRFEGVGVTLRDGTAILEGVNGHFRHSKARPSVFVCDAVVLRCLFV